MQFAHTRDGAFVEVGPDGLAALAASDGVIDHRSLASGVLARVAETGQVVRRIAHDEPAITSLPAAMLVMPVIGNGRVSAILFLVRPDSMPFTEADEDALAPLAAIVGSALAAANRHGDVTALSRLDALTGLGNRRRLDEDLAATWASLDPERRRGSAVVMVDVDHFKHFNDRNGHAAGDEALRAVAGALRAGVRDHDRVYRYGGEEFTVLLADVDRDAAERIAERIRVGVAQSEVAGRAAQPGGALTVSVGVALVAGLDAVESLRLADLALYEAKAAGRNRVVVVDGAAPQPV
jgi:diguanylate cyclase (GGDEF)-like protein